MCRRLDYFIGLHLVLIMGVGIQTICVHAACECVCLVCAYVCLYVCVLACVDVCVCVCVCVCTCTLVTAIIQTGYNFIMICV